jgi:hypothetical protein
VPGPTDIFPASGTSHAPGIRQSEELRAPSREHADAELLTASRPARHWQPPGHGIEARRRSVSPSGTGRPPRQAESSPALRRTKAGFSELSATIMLIFHVYLLFWCR